VSGPEREPRKRHRLLDGVRVVEFSQLIAAPFCGLTLLDLGAEVVKVEAPTGDPMRGFPPYLDDGQSGLFRILNRGKRSVTVDLGSRAGCDLAGRLIARADVVVENLGDARELLGVSFEQAAAENPALIWCAITGWGAGVPGRSIDPSLQSALGMISITGEDRGAPMRIPVPLVDFMTGMYAVQSILVALWRVRQGGRGGFLDCAMADSATTLMSTSALLALGGHFEPRRLGSESPLVVPSGVFTAGDGGELQIICVTERHWRALCDALGHPEWKNDPACADNDARLANRRLVRDRIQSVVATGTAQSWAGRISAGGAIAELVRGIEEAWADERLVARGLVGDAAPSPAWARRMPLVSLAGAGAAGTRDLAPAPALGADTDAVLAELEVGDGASPS
jgi:crotonobetainyl-CoA:carnitine CoA-transferase CaiB-like acyl-CoA transferase